MDQPNKSTGRKQAYLTLQLAKIPDRYPVFFLSFFFFFELFFFFKKKKTNYFSEIHQLIVFKILFEEMLALRFYG